MTGPQAQDREFAQRELLAHFERRFIAQVLGEVQRVQAEFPGGISRRELGEKAGGMSKAHVIRLLQGKGNPSLATVAALAYALNCYPEIRLIPFTDGSPWRDNCN